jgi:OPA family glycerol-3-phosphate transporter-like MFS transporter 3
MLYDVGQILGGYAGGYISDKMGVRSPVVVVMLLFSWFVIPLLFIRRRLSNVLMAFVATFA